jgi:hypothetical protein
MSRILSTCPVCGQALANAKAAERAASNVEKLRRDAEQKHARALEQLQKSAARDVRDAANRARREAEAQARTKLDEERRRHRADIEAAADKARRTEQRRANQEVEAMKRQNDDYRRRLEKMTADERGEIGEAELIERLRAAFPLDKLERLGKARGSADVRHTVMDRGRACGVIVYECKNVRQWSNAHVTQARESRTLHRAAHAVLVSSVFPKGQKYLCFVRDVPVVHPSIVSSVVRSLRDLLILSTANHGSSADRQGRADRLLAYIKGDDFKGHMVAIADAGADLRSIQSKERQTHNRVWELQSTAIESIEAAHATVHTRISAIASGTQLAAVPESATG